jgi:hypothetical protein
MFRFTRKPSSGSHRKLLQHVSVYKETIIREPQETAATCFGLQGNDHQGAAGNCSYMFRFTRKHVGAASLF